MTDIVKHAAWRDIRVNDITCWSPRTKRALLGYFDTVGELADATRLQLRRVPNVGQTTLDEIAAMIVRAKSGEVLTTPLDILDGRASGAAARGPHCGTCRWWGHDGAGTWVVSPRAGAVNVCGEHRQVAGERPRRNIITAAHDWCGEHLPRPTAEGMPPL